LYILLFSRRKKIKCLLAIPFTYFLFYSPLGPTFAAAAAAAAASTGCLRDMNASAFAV